ncbi:MAG: LysR family transcriptional regulator [Hyphomicrobiaceae bacterium]|nr:LysR family transcriptional regulator [Hyphomicrobiaceae bacterium]
MRAFVQVVDADGFSAAARLHGRSKALLSKYVTDLEDHLGVRLLNRTTRKLSMTEAGEAYYRDVRDLLQRLDDLDNSVAEQTSVPQGLLRVSAPRNYGETNLAPAIYSFLNTYDKVSLDLRLEDRKIDLVAEGVDVALRISDMPDSSLIARKIATTTLVLCASPALVERLGPLTHPEQLRTRPCIIDSNLSSPNGWRFKVNGQPLTIQVSGRVRVNSPVAVREAAIAGLGYAILPGYLAREPIQAGTLLHLLEDQFGDELGLQAVYPHRQHLPAKVRAFIDHLSDWFAERSLT